uniref:Putative CRISPR-associated protein Crm2 n=1 Tax=mine drainage metagenome TaxID=410659 RepID=E6Q6Q6_9ZZZZ
MSEWRRIAKKVRDECADSLIEPNNDAAWDEQIDGFLEFNAAWLPLDRPYKETRKTLEAMASARKNLRDFGPQSQHVTRTGKRELRVNAPKSSLDGARDSVLRSGGRRKPETTQQFRIGTSEELDAIGLVKRTGGEPNQFTPIINVALDPWLKVAKENLLKEFANLCDACKIIELAKAPAPGAFRFDASILLRDRWSAVFEEQGLKYQNAARSVEGARQFGETHVAPLLKKMSEIFPYVACIVADGDRMGRAIDACKMPDAHRELSRALSAFAEKAGVIVKKHGGSLVYAGGDDVLAFAPVSTAVTCAAELASTFRGELAPIIALNEAATLSVGIGIGHVMQRMGYLLELGRDGERLAKSERNSLAVVVDKRSGGRIEWSEKWEDDPKTQLTFADNAAENIDEATFPARRIYEIKSICSRLPDSVPPQDDRDWARLLRLEVRRAISRTDIGAEGNLSKVGPKFGDDDGYVDSQRKVEHWVSRMLIARLLASATPRLKGEA